MLAHSHCFELFIPICEEVEKIYRDHSHCPRIPLQCIAIPIYITQHNNTLVYQLKNIGSDIISVSYVAYHNIAQGLQTHKFGNGKYVCTSMPVHCNAISHHRPVTSRVERACSI